MEHKRRSYKLEHSLSSGELDLCQSVSRKGGEDHVTEGSQNGDKRGVENVEKAIGLMAEMVKKAIAQADENRKNGKRIEVKSPVLVVEEGSDAVAIKA